MGITLIEVLVIGAGAALPLPSVFGEGSRQFSTHRAVR